uniref:Leucine-rich repeat receptor-like protein kinase n=1 Tax=Pohlia nutans TaxID=140635 RepID=A0A1P8DYZ7_9BRYO|nr:leucine-rich repeat receptor-like protein kinase [Pohlia nutans]
MRVRAAWAAMLLLLLHCLLLWTTAVEADSAVTLASNESVAMQSLRDTLQIRDSAWQSDQDPCWYWRGVQCVNGHIDSILLTGLPRMASSQPYPRLVDAWALTQLPFLRIFNASQFTFSGGIPDWIGNVESLESLDLSYCSLTGALPLSFGQLSRLNDLSLAWNFLSGNLPSFGNFTNLIVLNLSSNSFSGPIPPMSSPGLQVIDLSQNQLTGGVSPLTVLPSLQYLDLSYNMLDMPVPWQLGNLVTLQYLDLSSNSMPGSIPPELGRMSNLTVVRLSNNAFSGLMPAELTGWTQLQVMDFAHNNFTGDIPSTMGLLQNLVALDLSANSFKGLYSSGLLTLPMLQVLNLSHNLFFGPLPQELAAQQSLVTLDIFDNFFNGTVPMGFLPTADIWKNCLAQVERQRPLKSCTKFYAPLGVTFSFNGTPSVDNSGDMTPPPSYAASPLETAGLQQSTTRNKLTPLLAGVFGGMGLILFVGVMVFCLHRCQMRRSKDRAMDSGRVSAVGGRGQTFSYSQLSSATSKFSLSNLACVGHSGDLYRGEMSGTAIVVKKIDLRKVKRDLHLSELEVFDKVSHSKLVQLLGTCLDREEEKYLVYKYCPNIDLATSLHKKGGLGIHCEDVLQSLDWITRLKIAIGVADGLSYLHSECTSPIIHRDIRANSILLDDKYEVRIGSLGDARIQDSETHSSILSRMFGFSSSSYDPADPSHGIASSAYDVYCFGKVLLELVSGKLGISGTTNNQWLEWALPLINVNDKEGLPKLVDPSLIVDEDLMEEVWAMAIIAKACLNSKPSKRPSMKHVLKALENPHKVVREENFGESLAVRSSSHSSWNDVLFGSFRHHTSVSGYFRGGGGGGGNNNNNGNGNGNG